ncbi:hypothetical protein B0H14DRAFT_3557552 [Mycena olivaceomarginata]|nr:hypothetical protein B0H14DRAFT_3557552 [Mycena olivaceomarginata]
MDVKYLPNALSFLSQPALSLSAIGTLLWLGRKYDVRIVVDSAVAHVTFKNPTTLLEFDVLTNTLVNRKYAPTHILAGCGFYFNLIALASILDGIQREDKHTGISAFGQYAQMSGWPQKASGQTARTLHAGRQKMWDELPVILDLPPWEELKKDL